VGKCPDCIQAEAVLTLHLFCLTVSPSVSPGKADTIISSKIYNLFSFYLPSTSGSVVAVLWWCKNFSGIYSYLKATEWYISYCNLLGYERHLGRVRDDRQHMFLYNICVHQPGLKVFWRSENYNTNCSVYMSIYIHTVMNTTILHLVAIYKLHRKVD